MGLCPLNILCGFFYPLEGKHDWSKSVLISVVFPLTQLARDIINGGVMNLLLNWNINPAQTSAAGLKEISFWMRYWKFGLVYGSYYNDVRILEKVMLRTPFSPSQHLVFPKTWLPEGFFPCMILVLLAVTSLLPQVPFGAWMSNL